MVSVTALDPCARVCMQQLRPLRARAAWHRHHVRDE